MSGRAPPPSFSSFPDLSKPKVPPPSFSSFPAPQPPPPQHLLDDSERPSKRAKATDFLEGLRDELGHKSGGRSREHRSSREGSSNRESGHRSRRDSDREEKSSRSRYKESDRDRDGREKKDRHREGRKSKGKEKEREPEPERDSDYGEKVSFASTVEDQRELTTKLCIPPQRRKPYQFAQAEFNDDVPVRRPSPPPEPDKPLFYSSRQPDDLNIRYGGLHRGDVPRYRRLGGQLLAALVLAPASR